MDIFDQVKKTILKKEYLTASTVNQWSPPSINELHPFLLGEGLLAEEISNIFYLISNLSLYEGEPPIIDQDWFIEYKILWVINPWVTSLNNNILKQQMNGNVIEAVGIFASSEYITDNIEDNTWSDAVDGVQEKVQAIVMQAYDANASDIYIAPRTDETASVKFRILGGLRHIFDLAIDAEYFALS